MRNIEWLKEEPNEDDVEVYDESLDDIIKYKYIISKEVMDLIYELNECVADFDWILSGASLRAGLLAKSAPIILIRYIDTIREKIAVYNEEVRDAIERKLSNMESCIKIIKYYANNSVLA